MHIQITSPQIWLATEPVDFRKSINGLNALVVGEFHRNLENSIYIFFNRAQNRLKLLAYHRNGHLSILQQKRLLQTLIKKSYLIKSITFLIQILWI